MSSKEKHTPGLTAKAMPGGIAFVIERSDGKMLKSLSWKMGKPVVRWTDIEVLACSGSKSAMKPLLDAIILDWDYNWGDKPNATN